MGLGVHLLCVPFLLQWFHPDERQVLEFAHFWAHGRLHPFLEVSLQLRNQSVPWAFSWVLRLCDAVSLAHPWAYLVAIQSLIALWSGAGFWALLVFFREFCQEFYRKSRLEISESVFNKAFHALAWIFALFWGFSTLYSRPLLEVLSFPSTALLLLFVWRGWAFRAGLMGGLTAVIRYPSALWIMGALFLWLYRHKRIKPLFAAVVGVGLVVILGGFADWALYGKFLGSAQAYWAFNQPHGPVEGLFGNDSLAVYWHWFEFLFTPWLALVLVPLFAFALLKNPALLLFSAPYIVGHVWTPHREPRFMIPLSPILVVAVFSLIATRFGSLSKWTARVPRLKPVLKSLLLLHILINFIWLPLYLYGQWNSAQGVTLRSYDLMKGPLNGLTRLVTRIDPLIDVFVPEAVTWGDQSCVWHRPMPSLAANAQGSVLVLDRDNPANCEWISQVSDLGFWSLPDSAARALERIFRFRAGRLWRCDEAVLKQFCPGGFEYRGKGIDGLPEPFIVKMMGENLWRK